MNDISIFEKELHFADGSIGKPSSERCSDGYLEVNSCDIEYLNADIGSDRPNGRSDYHLLYVERGECHLLLGGEWRCVSSGGVILFRPYERQTYRYLAKDRSISHYVHFTGVGCAPLLARLGIGEMRVFEMGRSTAFEEHSRRLTREFSMKRPHYEDFCTAEFYCMLNIVARKFTARDRGVTLRTEHLIDAACKKIYENLAVPPSVEELAADCHLSVSRFTHLFRQVTDSSLGEFVTAVRLSRAKRLLSETDLSIREIAESLGYSDQNYFSRIFRRELGCAPRDYRREESEGKS